MLHTLARLAPTATTTRWRPAPPQPARGCFLPAANDKLCAFCTVFEFNSLTNHKVKFMFVTCECHLVAGQAHAQAQARARTGTRI